MNVSKIINKTKIEKNDYGLSKYFMNLLSNYLAKVYNIDTISIEPGFVLSTNMNNNRSKSIIKFNELFIVKSNTIEDTINFIFNESINYNNKHNGDLIKFNKKRVSNYSLYNSNELIKYLSKMKINSSFKFKLYNFDIIENHYIAQLNMLYPLIIYILLIIFIYKKKLNVDSILYVFIVNNVTKFLKKRIHQSRPYNINTGQIINYRYSNTFGMPSVHAQAAFTFLTLLIFSKKIGINVKIIFSIISILVAYSRIKLKVHSFNQVLVGIFLE